MFIKTQEFDRIINLNKIIMVDIEEEPNHFRIVAECENDFHVLLAVYVDGKDAEKYFDLFCQAISDGDGFFRFTNDPKLGEKNDQ